MFSQASEKSPSSTPPLYTSGQRQIGLVSDLWSRWAQASAMAVTLLSMYIACYSLARAPPGATIRIWWLMPTLKPAGATCLYCGGVSPMEPRSNTDKARMRVDWGSAVPQPEEDFTRKSCPKESGLWMRQMRRSLRDGFRRGAGGLRGILWSQMS